MRAPLSETYEVMEDGHLVRAAKGGDASAFAELYARYVDQVTRAVDAVVRDHARAEEITQEAFLSAFSRLAQAPGPISFRPWIHRIARNAAIDHVRHVRCLTEVPISSESGDLLLPSPHGPESAMDGRRSMESLAAALSALSPLHRRVLVLRELEGLSGEEVADRLGMSRSAAYSAHFRARKRLIEEFDEIDSGRRCGWSREALAKLAEGGHMRTGHGKLRRHLEGCTVCRRQAVRLGVAEVAQRRLGLRQRLVALLPPGLVRRWTGGGRGSPEMAAALSTHANSLTMAAAGGGHTVMQIPRAAVVAAAALIAGGGTVALRDHGLTQSARGSDSAATGPRHTGLDRAAGGEIGAGLLSGDGWRPGDPLLGGSPPGQSPGTGSGAPHGAAPLRAGVDSGDGSESEGLGVGKGRIRREWERNRPRIDERYREPIQREVEDELGGLGGGEGSDASEPGEEQAGPEAGEPPTRLEPPSTPKAPDGPHAPDPPSPQPPSQPEPPPPPGAGVPSSAPSLLPSYNCGNGRQPHPEPGKQCAIE